MDGIRRSFLVASGTLDPETMMEPSKEAAQGPEEAHAATDATADGTPEAFVSLEDIAVMRDEMASLARSRGASGRRRRSGATDPDHDGSGEVMESFVSVEDIARMKDELATQSRGWRGAKRRRNEVVLGYAEMVADAKEDMAEFAAASGMPAAFFCKWVIRRRNEGADYATMATELADPRRSIEFTGKSVEDIFFDLSSDLRTVDAYWQSDDVPVPAIPPKDPIKPDPKAAEAEQDHPVGIPYIRLKSFDMSGSVIAERISGRKAASMRLVPAIPLDDGPDEGPRLG